MANDTEGRAGSDGAVYIVQRRLFVAGVAEGIDIYRQPNIGWLIKCAAIRYL